MFRKLAIALAAVAAVTTGVLISAVHAAEEDSALFNCHLSGNHKCGPDVKGLGFVNL